MGIVLCQENNHSADYSHRIWKWGGVVAGHTDTVRKMFRIAICDDEQRIAEELGNVVRKFFSDKTMDVCVELFLDGNELLNCEKRFDLIFLDIEIKETNGIEIGRDIRSHDVNVPIVYVTNHTGYWRSAYQVHAFGFVEKPVEEEEIYKILQDFLNIIKENSQKVIELKTEDGMFLQNMDEIYYIMVNKKRTMLVKTEQKEYFVKGNLADIYEKLDKKQFFVSHRSSIVNLNYIDHVKEYDIYMRNGEWVPLAQKKRKEFLLKLNEFVF